MSTPEVTNKKDSFSFCDTNSCKISMIVVIILLSVYFVFDIYNKIAIGVGQYNYQLGLSNGQQELVAKLFNEMETKKCQKIPVTLQGKTVEIVDVACLSAPEGNPGNSGAPANGTQPNMPGPTPQQPK